MKAKNPHTPILIREALDIEPKVWARFEYGKEKMVPLKGLFSHCELFRENGQKGRKSRHELTYVGR